MLLLQCHGNSKDTDHTVHGAVLPSDCTASISGGVPVAGVGCVETSAALLHDGAVYHVFERPSLFHQMSQRVLYDAGSPLVDFTLVIICPTDDTFNTLFN